MRVVHNFLCGHKIVCCYIGSCSKGCTAGSNKGSTSARTSAWTQFTIVTIGCGSKYGIITYETHSKLIDFGTN